MAKEYGAFYATAGGDEGNRCKHPTRLDKYGCGCQHDCSYCYAKTLLDFRGLWNAKEPSVADFGKIMRKVNEIEPGSVIRMGGMTDCFIPYELEHKVSLKTLRALNKRGVHQLIVTKSPIIATDDYMRELDPDLSHIQISITSTDDDVARKYEKAAATSSRIQAAETLQEAGFDVSLRISPYIPKNVDLKALGRVKVDKALVEFLRVNHWVEKWMPYDLSEYNYSQGGYKHLHLNRKIRLLRPIQGMFEQVSVCEDVDGHFQHFQAFVNANPSDCCNLRAVE